MEENADPKVLNVKDSSLVHDFSGSKDTNNANMFTKKVMVVFGFLVIAGILSGYLLVNVKGAQKIIKGPGGSFQTGIEKGKIFGSSDEKTFKDQAEGVLKTGGIDGEGAYHLERTGGDSQNVYLTSSFVDLSQFVDTKVKVWGQTNSAKKAGWLMDVGRLQILE
ncbi:MAG: hypothetical protein A2905_00670 [Candidatus Levybacteria bacterium RIFCSPLOWO2_01_FULL_36_10]|nr:MAG: hypothetical protein A2905_00670 [Candidatus Levybacteria bacterium RIFCSPLOWO2_01_FULL_36_10]